MGIIFLYYIEDGFKSKPVTNNGFLLRFCIKLRLWIEFRPHMVKVYVMSHFYISVFLCILHTYMQLHNIVTDPRSCACMHAKSADFSTVQAKKCIKF